MGTPRLELSRHHLSTHSDQVICFRESVASLRSPRSRFRARVRSNCLANRRSGSDRLRNGLLSVAITTSMECASSITYSSTQPASSGLESTTESFLHWA